MKACSAMYVPVGCSSLMWTETRRTLFWTVTMVLGQSGSLPYFSLKCLVALRRPICINV